MGITVNTTTFSVLDNLTISRPRDSFLYFCEIQKPFGVLDKIIERCKQDLVGEWRWELVNVSSDIAPGRYVFYFDSQQDYEFFMLKWT